MGKTFVAAVAAALLVLVLVLVPATATAETPPEDVDCSLLQSTLDAIDDRFDQSGATIPSLGVFYSTLVTNETTFGSFNNLVGEFSGDEISFASGPEFISTVGDCGLTKFMVDNIKD